MNDEAADLVLRAVTGELSPAERDRLDARAAGDPRLRVELEEALRTATLLREARADGFPAGFAARVTRRIADEGRHGPFSASVLQRQFVRLLAPALAAALVLGVYALRGPHRYRQSPVESLLGLTPVTGESWILVDAPPPGAPGGDP
jgi:anti-sigma factor RsiW